jgi:hypothetical protein
MSSTWATETSGEDPPVFTRECDGGAWQREADTLSAFLIQVLVFEAVRGAPFGLHRDRVSPSKHARLAAKVQRLPLDPWLTSKTTFFGSNGVIGYASDEGDSFDVWLGAQRAKVTPVGVLENGWDEAV